MSAPGPVQRLENGKGGRNNWRTPDDLFRLLSERWGPFTIDGAADSSNAKCERYYDEESNAFLQDPEGECIFVNPPYGVGWKAWIALFEKWGKQNTVVALVPSATDTEWWAMAEATANETVLLSGRVKFIDPETGNADGANTTGSTVFVWYPEFHWPGISRWEWRAEL